MESYSLMRSEGERIGDSDVSEDVLDHDGLVFNVFVWRWREW